MEASRRMTESCSDLDLAQRCVDGDRLAQRELFHQERKRVHAILYRILGSNAAIDDLVQESFVSIFRSLKIYRGECSIGTWVDRCTVRAAYAHLARRTSPTVQLEVVKDRPSLAPAADDAALSREAIRRLYGVLDRIDPKQRVAFTLHAIDGRSLDEVAEITETSLAATKTHVFRARRAVEERSRKDPVLSAYVLPRDSQEGVEA